MITLSNDEWVAPLVLDVKEDKAVRLAATSLASDFEAVCGSKPPIIDGSESGSNSTDAPVQILIGTLGRCEAVDVLARAGEPSLKGLRGEWEGYRLAVVSIEGIETLLIAGADRRGTVYGIYHLSRMIGVSPWAWWADVPVERREVIQIPANLRVAEAPDVRYRGIFINDEIFGIGPWAKKTFEPEQDYLGPRFYAKVCELLLRLKTNLLVPAMKKRYGPFNAIPENRQVADDYGIVVGSAHSEPLGMSTFDWREEEHGPWDYLQNGPRMLEFLEERVAEGKHFDRLYSVGLRGVDDHSMAGGLKPLEQVRVLGEVLGKQREILARQLEREPEAIPQVLWLYKEVLENYDLGLEPPGDITLIWPDDNYGYIRRLPGMRDAGRAGGHGVYYHLSYLGRPFDYLWLSGVDPSLMHSELSKAWQFGARQVWIFNVGDIKPLEFELTLAMDLAWNVESIPAQAVTGDYAADFFRVAFGPAMAEEMAAIRTECSRLASLRKPEHMGWERIEQNRLPVEAEFSWISGEAETLLAAWEDLTERSNHVMEQLPDEAARDSYLHLLHYRVAGSAAMTRKWLLMARHAWHRRQGRASAWESYQAAWHAFRETWKLTDAYMNAADGKWREWQGMFAFDTYGEPRYRKSEEEKRWIRPEPFEPLESPPALSEGAEMGLWCQGEDERLGIGSARKVLPCLSPGGAETAFFEVFNKGSEPLDWQVACDADWLEISPKHGRCGGDQRVTVRLLPGKLIDNARGSAWLKVTGNHQTVDIEVPVFRPAAPASAPAGTAAAEVPAEVRGRITCPCHIFSDKREAPGYTWEVVPGPGVSGKVVRIADVSASSLEGEWGVKENNPFLEYRLHTINRGWFELSVAVLPTFPANRERGSLYAVTLNDGPELVVDTATRHREEAWMRGVEYNTTRHVTRHFIREPGLQTLRLYLIDTTLVFQEFTITADLPETPWSGSLPKAAF